MSIADLVQSMLERGVDHDLIVQAVREAEAPKRKKPLQLNMMDECLVRGSRIRADWAPTVSDKRFAADAGMSSERMWSEVNQFRDYYLAAVPHMSLRRDWSAVWRNWVRKALQFKPEPPPKEPRYDSAL